MMSDAWLNGLLGLNAALIIFLLERIFNLTSKIGNVKTELTKEFQIHKDEISGMFKKQVHEGILAHKRIDQIDRIVSAVTDSEFGSSKNIANGDEDFPETTRIRKLVRGGNG